LIGRSITSRAAGFIAARIRRSPHHGKSSSGRVGYTIGSWRLSQKSGASTAVAHGIRSRAHASGIARQMWCASTASGRQACAIYAIASKVGPIAGSTSVRSTYDGPRV